MGRPGSIHVEHHSIGQRTADAQQHPAPLAHGIGEGEGGGLIEFTIDEAGGTGGATALTAAEGQRHAGRFRRLEYRLTRPDLDHPAVQVAQDDSASRSGLVAHLSEGSCRKRQWPRTRGGATGATGANGGGIEESPVDMATEVEGISSVTLCAIRQRGEKRLQCFQPRSGEVYARSGTKS